MYPFNEMLIYLGSEVWMSRIPSFRFNKGYSKHRAKGLRGPELPGTVEGAETALEG